MATIAQAEQSVPVPSVSRWSKVAREWGMGVGVTLVGVLLMLVFLMPVGYMFATAFKQDSQLSAQHAPLWPAQAATYSYEGKDLPLYNVPTDTGVKQWALVH